MRLLALLLALVAGLFAATAPARAATDWRATVSQTPAGAFVIGNPRAPVKLVEYLSYTCPHCAHFTGEAKVPLYDGLVRAGKVRVEIRHAVRDQLDLAATLLARCAGPKGFLAASEAIFAGQADWAVRGIGFLQDNGDRIGRYPAAAQLKLVAENAGLVQLVRTFGVTPAAAQACLTDPAEQMKMAAMAQASWTRIGGTPSFEVNGTLFSTDSWAALLPRLRAAGAR